MQRALRALVTGTTHLIGLLEPDGTIAYAGPSVEYLLGYAPDEVVGSNVLSHLHPDDLEMALAMLAGQPTDTTAGSLGWDDAAVSGEYRLRHADGHWVPFEVVRNDFRGDPAIGGVLVIAREVVVRRSLDEALTALAYDDDGTHALGKLLDYVHVRVPGTRSSFAVAAAGGLWAHDAAVADLSTEAGAALDAAAGGDTVVVDLRRPGTHLAEATRRTALDLGYQGCWFLPIPVRRPRVYRFPGRDVDEVADLGALVVWSGRYVEPVPAHLGVLERVCGLAEVVLRRRKVTQMLRRRVAYDHVTGALSRSGFEATTADAGPDPHCILVIDLDDFKHVNDSHGHPVGDQVLRVTAQRIQSLLRPDDILGRLGGDEFVLRVATPGVDEAAVVAARILDCLATPLRIGGTSVPVQASIGIAGFDPELGQREQVAHADAAMYAAKRAGKGRWHVWPGHGLAPGGAGRVPSPVAD
ncbi:MAG: diguanylate cyclase domain-containing protein [Acidimicrobiales bacterium]